MALPKLLLFFCAHFFRNRTTKPFIARTETQQNGTQTWLQGLKPNHRHDVTAGLKPGPPKQPTEGPFRELGLLAEDYL
jgi:hypothetical protein